MHEEVRIQNVSGEMVIIGHQGLLPGESRVVLRGAFEVARGIYGDAVVICEDQSEGPAPATAGAETRPQKVRK